MKKPTAKYCSVHCCSVDPEHLEKLRTQARRTSNRPVLPMAHQLKLTFSGGNPEELLNSLCQGREDVPGGMSRLAAKGTLSFGRTPAANDGVGVLPRWGASAAG